MSDYSDWEGEPPGEPLLVNSGVQADLSVNNRKHNNAAHQEVRPPNFGFALKSRRICGFLSG